MKKSPKESSKDAKWPREIIAHALGSGMLSDDDVLYLGRAWKRLCANFGMEGTIMLSNAEPRYRQPPRSVRSGSKR